MKNIIKLSSPATRDYWEIPVLFEDEHLLVIDKPSRLLTSPDRYDPDRPNLMKLLHRDIERGAPWAKERGISYLANAHRLDFETSGILILAKSKAVLTHLANQFGSLKPEKIYVTLAQGSPAAEEFEADFKLAPHPVRLGHMRVDEKRGKKSLTRFRVLERFRRITLLECRPATGRTHQIRVHLQRLRHNVAGDNLYGGRPLLLSSLKSNYRLKEGREEKPLIDRVALHAAEITFEHPVAGTPVHVAAPWPKDLTVAVKYLRRYAQSLASAQPEESFENESAGPEDTDGAEDGSPS